MMLNFLVVKMKTNKKTRKVTNKNNFIRKRQLIYFPKLKKAKIKSNILKTSTAQANSINSMLNKASAKLKFKAQIKIRELKKS
jgi:hypothetical protein